MFPRRRVEGRDGEVGAALEGAPEAVEGTETVEVEVEARQRHAQEVQLLHMEVQVKLEEHQAPGQKSSQKFVSFYLLLLRCRSRQIGSE